MRHRYLLLPTSGRSCNHRPFALITALAMVLHAALLLALISAPLSAQLPEPSANFVGSGAAAHAISGSQLTVEQQSQRAILNWDSFNIGAGNRVQFQQPNSSASALNRIHDQSASLIQGAIEANGQILLLNSNGIIFDQGAQIDVNSLIASTVDIPDRLYEQLGTKAAAAAMRLNLNSDPEAAISDGIGIAVKKGATIETADGGRIGIYAPVIEVEGELKGEKIELASRKERIYLRDLSRSGGHGVLVEVEMSDEGTMAPLQEEGVGGLLGYAVNTSGVVRGRLFDRQQEGDGSAAAAPLNDEKEADLEVDLETIDAEFALDEQSMGREARLQSERLADGRQRITVTQEAPQAALPLPAGEGDELAVRAGQARLGSSEDDPRAVDPETMVIVQEGGSDLVLEWESFDIGPANTVIFQQPSTSSQALNLIGSSSPSAIFGRLEANGEVILVNANGILFAEGAIVDVGSLLAATLNPWSGSGNLPDLLESWDQAVQADELPDGAVRVESGALIQTRNRLGLAARELSLEGEFRLQGGQLEAITPAARVRLEDTSDTILRNAGDTLDPVPVTVTLREEAAATTLAEQLSEQAASDRISVSSPSTDQVRVEVATAMSSTEAADRAIVTFDQALLDGIEGLSGELLAPAAQLVPRHLPQPSRRGDWLAGEELADSAAFWSWSQTDQGSVMVVDQLSERALLNWERFALPSGSGDTLLGRGYLAFRHPSEGASSYNRVHALAPSAIGGHVRADGALIIDNPYGITVAGAARAEIPGAVAAAGIVLSSVERVADYIQGGFDQVMTALASALPATEGGSGTGVIEIEPGALVVAHRDGIGIEASSAKLDGEVRYSGSELTVAVDDGGFQFEDRTGASETLPQRVRLRVGREVADELSEQVAGSNGVSVTERTALGDDVERVTLAVDPVTSSEQMDDAEVAALDRLLFGASDDSEPLFPNLQGALLTRLRESLPPGLPQPQRSAGTVDGSWIGANRLDINASGPAASWSLSEDRRELVVTQQANALALNWERFDVADERRFELRLQDDNATNLSRVEQLAPSRWQGEVTTTVGNQIGGSLFLINPDGLTVAGHQELASLIASTLNIRDDIYLEIGLFNAANVRRASLERAERGLIRGTLRPADAALDDGGATIMVTEGSQLRGGGLGQITLIAPQLLNRGRIAIEDRVVDGEQQLARVGQLMLVAATDNVYLSEADLPANRVGVIDLDGRARDAQVGEGGTVINLGELATDQGDILLVGRRLEQNGRVVSSTSITAGGTVRLMANEGATTTTDYLPDATGEVWLAADSVTEVVLVDEEGETTTESADQTPHSQIEIMGGSIYLEERAAIIARGGEVTLQATESPADLGVTEPLAAGNDNDSRIYLAPGALIDVSGSDQAELPMSRNELTVDLRANELADAPLQRNGVLRGATVTVDLRHGTSLANISGNVTAIERDVFELNAEGGNVVLGSEGDLILTAGSEIDFAGGRVSYSAGEVRSSKLLTADGEVIDISEADPNHEYVELLDRAEITSERFGETRTHELFQGDYYEGYQQGFDAGSLTLLARSGIINADLDGSVTIGPYQRRDSAVPVGPVQEPNRDLLVRPQGGRIVIGNAAISTSGAIDHYFRNVLLTSIAPEHRNLAADQPHIASDTLRLDLERIRDSAISQLTVRANRRVTLDRSAELTLEPGGALLVQAQQVDLEGDITTPSGSVTVTAIQQTQGESEGTASLRVRPGARIDSRGQWINDVISGQSEQPTAPPHYIDGGDVTLTSEGELLLEVASEIDASGGGWVAADGTLTAGLGGDLSIERNFDGRLRGTATAPPSMRLAGALRSDSFEQGGALAITADQICITSGAGCDHPQPGGAEASLELTLDPERFTQGGFSEYAVTANHGWLTLAEGSRITPQMLRRYPLSDYTLQASGSDPAQFSQMLLPPLGERQPVHLSLSSEGLGSNPGRMLIAQEAQISGEIGSSISLDAYHQLELRGAIDAPAGRIALSLSGQPGGYQPEQSIWIASGSRLDASGAFLPSEQRRVRELGLRQGELLDGGRIELSGPSIVVQPEAEIDVSGIARTLDLPSDNSGNHFTAERLTSAAGSVRLQAQEQIILEGELAAHGGGEHSAGGRLEVELRSTRGGNPDESVDRYPTGERVIELVASAEPRTTGLSAPADLLDQESGDLAAPFLPPDDPDITLVDQRGGLADPGPRTGHARIDLSQVESAGFDTLSLTSGVTAARIGSANSPRQLGVVSFAEGLELELGDALIIDAPVISVADDAEVRLRAARMRIGPTEELNQAIREAEQSAALSEQVSVVEPERGSGALTLEADLIDLAARTVWSGVEQVSLLAAGQDESGAAEPGDLRLRGLDDPQSADQLAGRMWSEADLSLAAGRIYPVTLNRFTFDAASITTAHNALQLELGFPTDHFEPASPLSAGGQLTLRAERIEHGGALLAPFGEINFEPSGSDPQLELSRGSITRTAADGLTIPLGETVEAEDEWIYRLATERQVYDPATAGEAEDDVVVSPPAQAIRLGGVGDSSWNGISVERGAELDLRGGGDLLAYEFLPSPEGTVDTLDPASSPDSYAILPWLEDDYAPYDLTYYTGSDLTPGDSLRLLEAADGLPAGEYALLPARYALLPGAYLVTPEADTQDLPQGLNLTALSGAPIVAGVRVTANTESRATRSQGFLVESRERAVAEFGVDDDSIARSSYRFNRANDFFPPIAEAAELPAPLLPRDAGQLVLEARESIDFSGDVLGAPERSGGITGAGLRVDIATADRALEILADGVAGSSDAVVLSGGEIEALGAESLLLGALRNLGTEEVSFSRIAERVQIGEGSAAVEISAGELLVAGRDVDVQPQARLTASGEPLAVSRSLRIGGDSSLLRVATDSGRELERSDDLIGEASLIVAEGSELTGRSLLVDSSGEARLEGTLSGLDEQGIDLTLAGSRNLNLGDVPLEQGGLVFGRALLQSGELTSLNLRSPGVINLWVDPQRGALEFAELTGLRIEAQGLIGRQSSGGVATSEVDATAAPGGEARIQVTGSAQLIGTAAADLPTLSAPELAQLTLAADELQFGDGDRSGRFDLLGITHTQLDSSGQLIAHGEQGLQLAGDLGIEARSITGSAAARFSVALPGALSVTRPSDQASEALGELLAAGGLGATIDFSADSIDFDGRAVLPSGELSLSASGIDRDDRSALHLGDNAEIDLAGVRESFAELAIFTPGGRLELSASSGGVAIESGARIDSSGYIELSGGRVVLDDEGNMVVARSPGEEVDDPPGSDAGEILIRAAGSARVEGELIAVGAPGHRGGSFRLSANALERTPQANEDESGALDQQRAFAELNQRLNPARESGALLPQGGFNHARELRLGSGDIELAADDRIEAQRITLVADGGGVAIAGEIDADSADGGEVILIGRSAVAVEAGALITAQASEPAVESGGRGNGGRLLLQASGRYDPESGALIEGGAVQVDEQAVIQLGGLIEGEDGVPVSVASGELKVRLPAASAATLLDAAADNDALTLPISAFSGLGESVLEPVTRVVAGRSAGAEQYFDPIEGGYALNSAALLPDGDESLIAEVRDALQAEALLEALGREELGVGRFRVERSGDEIVGVDPEGGSQRGLIEAIRGIESRGGRFFAVTENSSGQVVRIALEPTALEAPAGGLFHIQPGLELVTATGERLLVDGEIDLWPARFEQQRPFDWQISEIDSDPAAPLIATGSALGSEEPGMLTLRSGGDLRFEASLSDSFQVATSTFLSLGGAKEYDQLQPTDGLGRHRAWAPRLIAGADPDAADPLATIGEHDLTLAPEVTVRTGAADIDVAVGGDMTLEGQIVSVSGSAHGAREEVQTAALYSAGAAVDPGELPGSVELIQHISDGGDVRVAVAGDLTGYRTAGTVANWLWRFREGVPAIPGDLQAPATWGVVFDWSGAGSGLAAFSDGVGAFGGGDMRVEVGGDIGDMTLALPTTGRIVDGGVEELGGGDLELTVAGSVRGGHYVVGRGEGRISAGGSIEAQPEQDQHGQERPLVSGATRRLDPIIAMGDSQFDLIARDSIQIESVSDPAVIEAGIVPAQAGDGFFFGIGASTAYFYNYDADSSMSMLGLGEEVSIRPSIGGFNSHQSAQLSDLGSDARQRFYPIFFGINSISRPSSQEFAVGSTILPGQLRMAAPSGSVGVGRNLNLFPSASGGIELLADEALSIAAQILVSDADPLRLAYAESAVSSSRGQFVEFTRSDRAERPVHQDDPIPSRLVARNGSIVTEDPVNFVNLPEFAVVEAGRDILGLNLTAQNLRPEDVTQIRAGRDFAYPSERTPTGALTPSEAGVRLGGPGQLQVIAGRELDLASSTVGVVTFGARATDQVFINPNLPEEGADLLLIAGVGDAAQFDALADIYLRGVEADDERLPEFWRGDRFAEYQALLFSGAPVEDSDDALAGLQLLLADALGFELADRAAGPSSVESEALLGEFDTLSPARRRDLLSDLFMEELRRAGEAAARGGNDPELYQRSYQLIATLFPEGEGGNGYQGDLSMAASRLQTFAGGDIQALVPGGLVRVGVSGLESEIDASKLGIVTHQGGKIELLSHDDMLVDPNRIFTLDGGDIVIWSSTGDIDSGRGAKTSISVSQPSYTLDNFTGSLRVNVDSPIAGSGIRTLVTTPGREPGDVFLFAPVGAIIASDAGIGSAGDVVIGATEVVGAENIDAGGESVGVPVGSGVGGDVLGAVDSASATQDQLNKAAQQAEEEGRRAAEERQRSVGRLSISVLGHGGEDDEEEEEE